MTVLFVLVSNTRLFHRVLIVFITSKSRVANSLLSILQSWQIYRTSKIKMLRRPTIVLQAQDMATAMLHILFPTTLIVIQLFAKSGQLAAFPYHLNCLKRSTCLPRTEYLVTSDRPLEILPHCMVTASLVASMLTCVHKMYLRFHHVIDTAI